MRHLQRIHALLLGGRKQPSSCDSTASNGSWGGHSIELQAKGVEDCIKISSGQSRCACALKILQREIA